MIPQIIFIVFQIVNLIVAIAKHGSNYHLVINGEHEYIEYSAWPAVWGTATVTALLFWGGFYQPLYH